MFLRKIGSDGNAIDEEFASRRYGISIVMFTRWYPVASISRDWGPANDLPKPKQHLAGEFRQPCFRLSTHLRKSKADSGGLRMSTSSA